MSESLTQVDEVAGIEIYVTSGEPVAFIYMAGATINADGAPNAYGPESTEPLDYLANAGEPGNWWGISCNSAGKPFTQKIYHKCPGYYVSTTALFNPNFATSNPDRFIDSNTIPFIVLPGKHDNDAELGDVCLCYNTETGDNCYGIYADIGPQSKIGEISIRMAQALSINNDPKKGGTSDRCIVYLVFPGSVGGWNTPEEWWTIANEKVQDWGGLHRLKKLIPQL